MARINEILKDPKAQASDKIKPIELDEVVVKVLSKESEANLSQPERHLYDKFKTTDVDGYKFPGTGLRIVELDSRGEEDKTRRTMDAFQAMNLVKDSGVSLISDKPSFSASFFPKTMNIKKSRNRRERSRYGEYKSFRPHADPNTESIYVQSPYLSGTLKGVLAESAHMPKYKNPHTNFAGLAYGAYKMLTGKQKEMYNEPGNYEHYTHDVIEPKLKKKYSTKIKY